MKTVLLILNPVAGRLKARAALFDIVHNFCAAGYKVRTQTTQYAGHARELASTAQKEGYDLVCCAGGDGTFHEVVSGVLDTNSNIQIGYIPAGTTNDFAEAVGLSKDPKTAANAITTGTAIPLDIGKFGNDQYFTYVASFGAFTDIAYSAPQDLKNRLGYLAYMLEGAKDLASIKPIHVEYTANGKEFKGDYVFGGVSNTTSVAGGIIKLKKGLVDMQDGKFELIMIHMPTDILQLNDIVAGITFQDYRNKMFEFMQIDKAEFHLSENVLWTLDGEMGKGSKDIEISNLKHAIQLLK